MAQQRLLAASFLIAMSGLFSSVIIFILERTKEKVTESNEIG
jgi:hypothetical protein